MKITTDLVKNNKFTSPIKASLFKYSQEYRVLATLRYLYPQKFNSMTTGESPDLQDCVNSIGIEVTVAVKKNDMKVSRAFSELYQDEPKNIEKHKKIIESSGYSFATIKGEKVAIATSGTSIGEKYFFQESIRRKMKKFPQYRIKFERTGLAILLPDIPTSYAENHFSEWISECQVEPENMYDFVYVISHRFCIYYDVHTNTTEKRSLKENESRSLATIGRMTAEGKLTLEDTEWL